MKPFTFGMKTLRVTQNYKSSYSHKPHWYKSKDFADYPIDLGGENGNRSPYYASVDMKVTAIKGKGNGTTNTIWLVATEKCKTPKGELTPFIMLTHWNDSDPYINKLKVGSIVKAGQIICEEGKDGATANHLHLVCGNADKGCGNGLVKNSNGKWVSNGYCMKPEEIMYVDKAFTKIVDTNSIKFKDKPKETKPKTNTKEIKEGDTVIVNGVGTASSSGKGAKTKNYKNTKMKVIGISTGKNKPNAYALNARNRGKVHDWSAVTAWFSKDCIKK